MSDEKIVLRLSPDTLAVYRALVSEGEFHSVSDAVRSVLESYADDRVSEGIVPVYEVREVADIAELTPDGRSLDDMVRAAANRYVREKAGTGERLGRCRPVRLRRRREAHPGTFPAPHAHGVRPSRVPGTRRGGGRSRSSPHPREGPSGVRGPRRDNVPARRGPRGVGSCGPRRGHGFGRAVGDGWMRQGARLQDRRRRRGADEIRDRPSREGEGGREPGHRSRGPHVHRGQSGGRRTVHR